MIASYSTTSSSQHRIISIHIIRILLPLLLRNITNTSVFVSASSTTAAAVVFCDNAVSTKDNGIDTRPIRNQ